MYITDRYEAVEQKPQSRGCAGEIAWLVSALVLPLGSLSFYRQAARRSVGQAVLFLFLFCTMLTFLDTAGVGIAFAQVGESVRTVFVDGTVPAISIVNGVAEAEGSGRAVVFDEDGIYVGIDTTGWTTEIDRQAYQAGLLLTRTDMHFLASDGDYRVYPLSELQGVVGMNPFYINADTITEMWSQLLWTFLPLYLAAMLVVNTVVRLIWIAMIALVVFLLSKALQAQLPYGQILSLTIYAYVPVFYLQAILSVVGIQFFLLQSLLLVVCGLAALLIVLLGGRRGFWGEERELDGTRVLIGLPLLALIAYQMVTFSGDIDVLILGVAAVTFCVLLAVGLWPASQPEEQPQANPR